MGNRRIWIIVLFVLVYLACNYPNATNFDGVMGLFDAGFSTLDASWIVGLNWASDLHFTWRAESLVFTFGPLYYLEGYMLPEFYPQSALLLMHTGLNLLFAFLTAFVFLLFWGTFHGIKEMKDWVLISFVALILLGQNPNISMLPLFVMFILLPTLLHDLDDKNGMVVFARYGRYVISIGLLSIPPLVKFSHLFVTVAIVLITAGYLLFRRRMVESLVICVLFVAFSVTSWILATGEGVTTYLAYLTTRLTISGGYTDAMMVGFGNAVYQLLFWMALLYMGILVVVLGRLVFAGHINWVIAWSLPLIVLFLGFKNAFVRADEHAYLFLDHMFLSAVYYLYLVKYAETRYSNVRYPTWLDSLKKVFIPFLAVIVCAAWSFILINNGRKSVFLGPQGVSEVFTENGIYTHDASRELLRSIYALDQEFLGHIDTTRSVDIIPWDIALLYGYELDWNPRPVIQSYASYTSGLDAMDAKFFYSAEKPDQLIFSLHTIDQRYAIFDTPATFQAVLDTYEYVARSQDRRYALLKEQVNPQTIQPTLITQGQYSLGEKISIPDEHKAHVFLSLNLESSILGKLLNIFYKATPVYVEINLEDGQQYVHRLVKDTAINGLFVSKYIADLDDMEEVLNREYVQDIDYVRFLGDDLMHMQPFEILFYSIPIK